MNEDNTNLDLLDLDGDASDSLPEVAFASPRPKKPWLLLGIGLVVIALATYVIVRTVGGNSFSTMEIDLDTEPQVIVDGGRAPMPPVKPDVNPQPLPVPAAPVHEPEAQPKPIPQPPVQRPSTVKPVQDVDTESNVRVVEDRRDVVFNPNKVEQKSNTVKPVTKPVMQKNESKPVSKPVAKVATSGASWYVQFGSYSSRSAADSAGQKMRAEHNNLFLGKQFVVLASVLKDGRTTYRLRVAFNNSSDANGFCRNAKSDGLDCYVAK